MVDPPCPCSRFPLHRDPKCRKRRPKAAIRRKQRPAVSLALRPTELLIFGNAKAGTPLMQSNQEVGIDLPLKVLVWEDTAGKTWLSYNDPRWIAKRHELGPGMDQTIEAMVAGLSAIAKKVTRRP